MLREKISRYFSESSNNHLHQTRPPFDPTVWISTKPALLELTRHKCAYCETKLLDTVDVDHFRPKDSAEDENGNLNYPYYGWLAYEWENLLPSCASCNRRQRIDGIFSGKSRQFPTGKDRAPLLASIEECRAIETDTLIDPAFDDPCEHLTFTEEGKCVATTKRGALSVEILGLNRSVLVRERLALRVRVDLVVERIVDGLRVGVSNGSLERSIFELSELTSQDAQYAGAARVFAVRAIEDQILSRGMTDDALAIFHRINGRFSDQSWGINGISHYYSNPGQNIYLTPINIRQGMYVGKDALPENSHSLISKVEIRCFKAIKNLTLDVPKSKTIRGDLTSALVLLGENAAGKSSVLEAVVLALLGVDAIQGKVDGKSFIQRDADWQPTGIPAEVRIYFEGFEAAGCWLKIDPTTGHFDGTREQQLVTLGYGPRRFFTNDESNIPSKSSFDHVKSLFEPSTTLQNPLGHLRGCSDEEFNAAVRALREVLVLPDDALIQRLNDVDGSANSGLVVFAHGRTTPLKRMSEGYRSVVALTVSIIFEMLRYWPDLESARGVVLIDEIDVHLHPRWKLRVLRGLRAAMPKVQFITTTHDPLCLRGAYDGEVHVLERRSDSSVFAVEGLPNVEALTIEQLLTSEYFGMVSTENIDTELEMARFISLSNSDDGSQEDGAELLRLQRNLHHKLHVGQTPQENLIYHAANEYLLQRRANDLSEQTKEETIKKMINIWDSLQDHKELP